MLVQSKTLCLPDQNRCFWYPQRQKKIPVPKGKKTSDLVVRQGSRPGAAGEKRLHARWRLSNKTGPSDIVPAANIFFRRQGATVFLNNQQERYSKTLWFQERRARLAIAQCGYWAEGAFTYQCAHPSCRRPQHPPAAAPAARQHLHNVDYPLFGLARKLLSTSNTSSSCTCIIIRKGGFL